MNESAARPLSFAIIGCGLIGRKRAAALAKVPGARLRFACDVDPARAAEVAQLAKGCEPASDYRAVIAHPEVDAVIVATLNGVIAPIALAAAQAGKHSLLEKPGALRAAELREVQAAASASGAKVRLGYNHRFHPAFQKARALVDAGALGPLMFLRGRYGHGGRKGYDREWRANPKLSGGGELIDQGVHLIDLSHWFLGDFASVDGHAATYFWDMPVDDNAFMNLRTAGGQTAWLHASCSEWKNLFSFEIYGREGKLSIDGLGGSYGLERLTYYKMLPEMGPPETTAWEYPRGDDSWAFETGVFADDIRLNREPSPGLREGAQVLDVVETLYRKSGYPTS
jgi:predicted dehydrogenase